MAEVEPPVRVVKRGDKRVEIVPAGRGIFRLYVFAELPRERRQYGGNLKGATAYAKDLIERPESRRG